jgi:hypothetical protein
VAREHTCLGREEHQDVHHRAADLLEVAAAHRVLEEHVAAATELVVDHEREVVVLVPGRRQRSDREAADLEVALHDPAVVASENCAVAGDVVRVGMRRQEGRDGQAVARDGVEQRSKRCARVDEHRRSARFVADQVRVREPARIHAPFDDHRALG